jgi:hypothetical protein
VLDLVNKDFTSQEGVDAILDAWKDSHAEPQLELGDAKPAVAPSALPAPPRRAGFVKQCVERHVEPRTERATTMRRAGGHATR